MKKPRVFIDADGCPVVDICLDIAKRRGLECTIVCDTSHVFEREGAAVITVSKGNDSADFALVNMLKAGDIAVTQDYGLAAMCLARGALVLRQDGLEYTAENIDGLLMERHNAKKVRMSGGRLRGHAKREASEDSAFREVLEHTADALLNRSAGESAQSEK
ncbi:MAG: DUF188 domain-containing protein [Oscillospiraceae bacterium]